jgi:hypothetical protein
MRNRPAMYENVAKEDHKVNPHPESAEMDVNDGICAGNINTRPRLIVW